MGTIRFETLNEHKSWVSTSATSGNQAQEQLRLHYCGPDEDEWPLWWGPEGDLSHVLCVRRSQFYGLQTCTLMYCMHLITLLNIGRKISVHKGCPRLTIFFSWVIIGFLWVISWFNLSNCVWKSFCSTDEFDYAEVRLSSKLIFKYCFDAGDVSIILL